MWRIPTPICPVYGSQSRERLGEVALGMKTQPYGAPVAYFYRAGVALVAEK